MGRIRVLSDQVANQIAAGEVVERPASVVKELLENAVDAGATRIRIDIEGGGRKLIRIADNGCGMGRDDAMLAFERHATSKLRSADDLLQISTLGFRGEALPSIASVARVEMDTRSAEDQTGTHLTISGGSLQRVEEAGLPVGTTIAVKDLFFNTPARRKFLKSESTELSHVAALVTHYALAHPEKHFELHTATHALLVASSVRDAAERLFQIFGEDVAREMLPTAAEIDFAHASLPEPPPWRRDADYEKPDPGLLRLRGFVSKPELQRLNRGSIYVFVNGRQVRDRLILHALTEAYRNILPPTSFPVVLLFLEMPPAEVDVNVHPAKTEVRFRQSSFVHDFVRDAVRRTVLKARPAASFGFAVGSQPVTPRAGDNLLNELSALDLEPVVHGPGPGSDGPWSEHQVREAIAQDRERSTPGAGSEPVSEDEAERFALREQRLPPVPGRLAFSDAPPAAPDFTRPVDAVAAGAPPQPVRQATAMQADRIDETANLHSLQSLRPLGQIQNSFIIAVNEEGMWIIDQHVAHERILFEKVMRERQVERVQRQRLLMPLLVDLLPAQMVQFARMAAELERNGFEAEPFGPRTLAVKAAPVGLEGAELELAIAELLQLEEDAAQADNMEARRSRIAASIACHAAVKVNMPLETSKMQWLLDELGRTENPMACPHGRPIALRYSHREIQRAFGRT